jgi:hypothetical protein
MLEKCPCGEVMGLDDERCPDCGRVNQRHFVEAGHASRVPVAIALGILAFACMRYGLPWYAAAVIGGVAFVLTGLIRALLSGQKQG